MNDDIVTAAHIRTQFYDQGRSMFLDGRPEPYPNALLKSKAYYVNAGWRYAERAQREQEVRDEHEAGLDYESLDKLSKQLKALGFTIPN
jgi:hypothetical protein